MQGYGKKKAIAGIQASGANGVLTLGRSEKSGTMLDMGTNEEPARLRAGPGVRLHGYGGIHTLERLPLPPEEPPPPGGTARLEWDIETSQGYATVCSLGESYVTPGNWVLANETESTFMNGSYVESLTASGVISARGPSDPPADECAEPIFASTEEDEFDYGDFISSNYTETTLLAFEDIIPDAIGAVDVLGSLASSAQEWPSESWEEVSNGEIGFGPILGDVAAFVTALDGATATSCRFRLRNRGDCTIRVDCGFYGSGMPGGASDVTYSITLPRGATGDWITPPAIDNDPAKGRTAVISRVRLGRWQYLP